MPDFDDHRQKRRNLISEKIALIVSDVSHDYLVTDSKTCDVTISSTIMTSRFPFYGKRRKAFLLKVVTQKISFETKHGIVRDISISLISG